MTHTFIHTGAFNARYDGRCHAPDCIGGPKKGVIEVGDVCEYVDNELMHLSCGRRVMRGETLSMCPTCWLYHPDGECDR